tara:strand:- start:816 stop:1136 length:321 start_codon:yes stop_codon:yes gene_type:complete
MLGGYTLAITQLSKKEKYMNPYLLPSLNREWLENKLTFGFRSRSSAPAPAAPKKSQAEIDADNRRDSELREEKVQNKRQMQRKAMRRYGKRSLMSNDERGLSDTLG